VTSLQRVRDVRERLFAEGTVVSRKDGKSRNLFPVAIGLEEGLALRDWVQREGALSTLETGLGFGIATLFIFEGLLANGTNPRHVAIDPYQFVGLPHHKTTYMGVGLETLHDAGVSEFVEFFEEESEIVLPRLSSEGRQFDFAFIDGNHRFEAVFLDLMYSGRLLGERKVVFLDDAQLPGVRKAVGFCLANLDWTVEDEGAEGAVHQWLVLRTGSPEVWKRPFTNFVDF
jgi:predicted O-methyltransferase YrrM